MVFSEVAYCLHCSIVICVPRDWLQTPYTAKYLRKKK